MFYLYFCVPVLKVFFVFLLARLSVKFVILSAFVPSCTMWLRFFSRWKGLVSVWSLTRRHYISGAYTQIFCCVAASAHRCQYFHGTVFVVRMTSIRSINCDGLFFTFRCVGRHSITFLNPSIFSIFVIVSSGISMISLFTQFRNLKSLDTMVCPLICGWRVRAKGLPSVGFSMQHKTVDFGVLWRTCTLICTVVSLILTHYYSSVC